MDFGKPLHVSERNWLIVRDSAHLLPVFGLGSGRWTIHIKALRATASAAIRDCRKTPPRVSMGFDPTIE